MSKIQVIAGPHREARRYAQTQGLSPDEYLIVTRAHQLAGLNPERIVRIVMVKMANLGSRIAQELREEIGQLTALWPVGELAVG